MKELHVLVVLAQKRKTAMNSSIAIKKTALTFVFAVAMGVQAHCIAAQENTKFQYFYDDRGQVTKVVDSSGVVIEYVYDPVGNILQIKRSSITPGTLAVFGFTPRQGPIGQTVTIQGQAFDPTPANDVVQFNGTPATVISATSTALQATVPLGATTGPITVTVGSATASSSNSFTVLQVPVITSITPNQVNVSVPSFNVQVTGLNLTGATFSFVPLFAPPEVTVTSASIDPSGASATLNLASAAGPPGSFVVVAANSSGNSSVLATAANTLRIFPTNVDITPPTISIANPTSGSALTTGQTLNVTANATDNVGVTRIDFSVSNTVFQSIFQSALQPALSASVRSASEAVGGGGGGNGVTGSFMFTVPANLNTLTFGASARDAAGNVGNATPVSVPVSPDALTTVTGLVVDANGNPAPGAVITLQAQGLNAEFFKFNNALTAIPNLSGLTADVTTVASAVNMVNPNQLFGADPFGVNLGPDYVGRLTGQLQAATPGTYTFKLGADEAARLKVGGSVVIDIPAGTGTFQEATGTISLAATSVPVEVEFIHNLGGAEIQLSYTPPQQQEQVIPASAWLTTLFGFTATADSQGAFSIVNVPSIVGGLQATANVAANFTSGVSGSVSPVPGGTTDLGTIVVVPSHWIQLAPVNGPPPPRTEVGHGAYDEITNRMIVFGGGENTSPSTDAGAVWILIHANGLGGTPKWIEITPVPQPGNGSPVPRLGHSMLYDSAHNRMIMFGGCSSQNCTETLSDVWILENANGLGGPPAWIKLSPQGRAPQRLEHAAVYDPMSNSMTVFGGGLEADQLLIFSDTSVLTNANGLGGVPTWIPLNPTGGPPKGQFGASAIYDSATNQMIVFGGMEEPGFGIQLDPNSNAVWSLTNANGQGGTANWTNLIPEGAPGSPTERILHSAVYDAKANEMVIFGGFEDGIFSVSDSWVLTTANGVGATPTWIQLPLAVTPPARCCHDAVFDTASNRMSIFAGSDSFGNLFNDVWTLLDANGLTPISSGGAVVGSVSMAGGTSAADAVVQLSTADSGSSIVIRARTDAAGNYVIPGAPVGRSFTIRAFDPNGISFRDSSSKTITSDGQTQTVNLTLPAVATVRVVVLTPNGSPISGARITIQDSFKQFQRFVGATGADGSLEIEDVPEGAFSVQAQDQAALTALGTFSGTVTPSDLGLTISGTITAPPSMTKVLVASGITDLTSGISVATAEVFDPTTGAWTQTQNNIPNNPPDSAAGFCAANMAALANGQALFAGGGCSDAGVTTNAASLYTIATNQWISTAGMLFGRDQFGMVTLNNGDAFAFAGCAGGCSGPNILGQFIFQVGLSSEIYNFLTDTWTRAGFLNVARGNLANGNYSQTAAALLDGRVLACNGSDGFSTSFDSCEIYDPVADQWSVTASIGETGAHPVAVLPNGQVLAIMNDGLSTQLFDPAALTWTAAASLNTQQSQGILTVMNTGDVLLTGGSNATAPVNTVQIYHAASNTWTMAASMSVARSRHIAVLLDGGRVLAAGGTSDNSSVLSSAEIFDPVAGTWSATGSMTQGRVGANAVALSTFGHP